MRHKIKILKQFADEIDQGNKTFEVRKNDRGYQKGDYIIFEVVDEDGGKYDGKDYLQHQIDGKKYIITYVLSGRGIEKDYVVFGFCETWRAQK